MTVRFKAHQLKDPLLLGTLLDLDGVKSLPDITALLAKSPQENLRAHRRILLSTLRYVRTHGIEATPREWTVFAEKVAAMPLAWDEAKYGRYRYKVPGKETLSPRAFTIFVKSTLDQFPPGWHNSAQTRQHYRYALKSLPEGFKTFVPDGPTSQSLGDSMRSMVSQRFPSPHSSFIETLATNRAATLAPDYWPKKQPGLSTNDKWVQAAFALARHANNTVLTNGIHAASWFDPRKPMSGEEGLALSFFEIIQRLPNALGRPAWMLPAFGKMLAQEQNATFIERGWKAVNFTEQERFALLLGLAKDYPSSDSGKPLGELLQHNWTIPAEERKAMALRAYQEFAQSQPNTSVNVILNNAREWIALLVPEMKPLLDLCSGSGPAEEILQLEQFLAPAETAQFDLPKSFDESAEMRDLMPK